MLKLKSKSGLPIIPYTKGNRTIHQQTNSQPVKLLTGQLAD